LTESKAGNDRRICGQRCRPEAVKQVPADAQSDVRRAVKDIHDIEEVDSSFAARRTARRLGAPDAGCGGYRPTICFPSQTAALDRKHVKGFAIDVGGRTSHTAIVARAMGIPAVVGLGNHDAARASMMTTSPPLTSR